MSVRIHFSRRGASRKAVRRRTGIAKQRPAIACSDTRLCGMALDARKRAGGLVREKGLTAWHFCLTALRSPTIEDIARTGTTGQYHLS
jgi:hypothetical protein